MADDQLGNPSIPPPPPGFVPVDNSGASSIPPPPPGFVPVDNSGASSIPPPPPGFVPAVSQPASVISNPVTPPPSGLPGIVEGFGKGMIDTMKGVLSPLGGQDAVARTGINSVDTSAANPSQMIGKGTEDIAE